MTARWILIGWIVLAAASLGLIAGFMLYTRVVIGVELRDQPALLRLPPALQVTAHSEDRAQVTLQGDVAVAVPVEQQTLTLPLRGRYRAHLSLDTLIPLTLSVPYSDTVVVDTELTIGADTSMIYGWLPELPVRGVLPVRFELPVQLTIPIETQVRLQYEGPVSFTVDQVLRPTLDATLHTALSLDHDVSTPVTNRFGARVVPDDRSVPVILNDSNLTLPLRQLRLYRTDP
ncbi:MAG: hypothetical protein R3175_17065 [Marinobacter sp.]|uniref:hypothetical protein n=1 Tax=Marinobacter sp. TaxID=50741 RepID=UPI00299EC103|nr:hypothetical protein [Marinobacter sp.]MDX1757770.1 hypothetical protein [Marinobacter sp.]